MKVVIFAGPTLSGVDCHRELEALYLPPAAQGDLYRAALGKPVAIGLIDGYFERVPSVSHKEILWAMKQGVHVFGAASMGALRAAELAAFGMEGVGDIYEAFASGALEDDDEVAVIHAEAEEDYRPLSEAMVNIRATLQAAERAGVLGQEARHTLERLAKGLFHADRNWPGLLKRGQEAGLEVAVLEACRRFVAESRVDPKRLDGMRLLHTLRVKLEAGLPPKQTRYPFAHTDSWEHIRRKAEATLPPRSEE
ncbi:TfuA-like protein [Stigmatella sp. ncwal1]|uniref:TfuA-like protein n=1 Tax=Stigmatella ashevillensis TaxID=2995309 RepID=A0ABT5DMQ7_9BACT|nr:TfuA-like protein [Stigmatella ashevillena]MDC0713641.1 TfuA-like protein [Stigmatella ashevillena]